MGRIRKYKKKATNNAIVVLEEVSKIVDFEFNLVKDCYLLYSPEINYNYFKDDLELFKFIYGLLKNKRILSKISNSSKKYMMSVISDDSLDDDSKNRTQFFLQFTQNPNVCI